MFQKTAKIVKPLMPIKISDKTKTEAQIEKAVD